jgi:hypothetical protein
MDVTFFTIFNTLTQKKYAILSLLHLYLRTEFLKLADHNVHLCIQFSHCTLQYLAPLKLDTLHFYRKLREKKKSM